MDFIGSRSTRAGFVKDSKSVTDFPYYFISLHGSHARHVTTRDLYIKDSKSVTGFPYYLISGHVWSHVKRHLAAL